MKHIYLYGASDDCMECEVIDGDKVDQYESYGAIKINHIMARYEFDGDWGIWLDGSVPETWKVKNIEANMAGKVRGKPFAGQFLHIVVPSDESFTVTEVSSD